MLNQHLFLFVIFCGELGHGWTSEEGFEALLENIRNGDVADVLSLFHCIGVLAHRYESSNLEAGNRFWWTTTPGLECDSDGGNPSLLHVSGSGRIALELSNDELTVSFHSGTILDGDAYFAYSVDGAGEFRLERDFPLEAFGPQDGWMGAFEGDEENIPSRNALGGFTPSPVETPRRIWDTLWFLEGREQVVRLSPDSYPQV